MNSEEPKPKLLVDEDWKLQVERDKEVLKHQSESPAASAASDGEFSKSRRAAPAQLPPASFDMIITTFATQALAQLGQLPDGEGKKMRVNLSLAKHFIDSLGVLEEKTKGNLTNDEQEMLQSTLHQMRMLFVTISQQKPS